jgi:hypothetical protein
MTRARQRRYRNVAVINHGRHEHLRARAKIALLKGQPFGPASSCRQLSPDECRAIEQRLRQEGALPVPGPEAT